VNRSGIWTAREWWAAMLGVAVVLVFQLACSDGPTTIVNVNTNTNTLTGGQSGSDPGETNKAVGSVKSDTKSVTVNGMAQGEKCPSGITPANQNKSIRAGCDLAVTCNPRDKDGKVIMDDHAPPVDYFILASGQDVVSFRQSSDNTYNGDIHSTAGKPGKFQLICAVVGVTSGLTDFEVIP